MMVEELSGPTIREYVEQRTERQSLALNIGVTLHTEGYREYGLAVEQEWWKVTLRTDVTTGAKFVKKEFEVRSVEDLFTKTDKAVIDIRKTLSK